MAKDKNEDILRKTCFIITPIGDENEPIRRHIDGLIDECIIPILSDKYDIRVSHRIDTPGSITNQIITDIYNADLVIANLTNLNANVMYELAFRHSVKKPVIIIMQKDSGKIPFDTITERIIFYTNDFRGAIDLKERIKKAVEAVEGAEIKIDNPIYTALEKLMIKDTVIKKINTEDSADVSALQYIIDTLQRLENKVSNSAKTQPASLPTTSILDDIFIYEINENRDDYLFKVKNILKEFKNNYALEFTYNASLYSDDGIKIEFSNMNKQLYHMVLNHLKISLPYEVSDLPFH